MAAAFVPWQERQLGIEVAVAVADPYDEPLLGYEKDEILDSLWGGTNNPFWGIRQRRLTPP